MHPSILLMVAYMNEQYAAARHHQTLRASTMAFLLSASAVLFGKALDDGPESHSDLIGFALIAIGIVAMVANLAFFRGNRLHSETATKCRKILANKFSGPDANKPFDPPDPIWVRREIERTAKLPFYNPDRTKGGSWLKMEYLLSAVFHLVPVLIVAAGLLVLDQMA